MKNLISIILVVLMLISGFAFAEGTDFAAMDDAALHAMIDGARNELTKREMVAAENTVLFEQDGVTVYLTGEYEVWGYDEDNYLDLEAVLINDSDKMVFVSVRYAYINGWEVSGGALSDTDAGKKQKGTLQFYLTDADISTYEEIEDIEMTFAIVDSETYETITELEPITVHFNVQ